MTAAIAPQSIHQRWQDAKIVITSVSSLAVIGAVFGAALRAQTANNCTGEALDYMNYYAVPLTGPGDDIIRFITGFPGLCLGYAACFAKYALPGAILGGYAGYQLSQRILQPL